MAKGTGSPRRSAVASSLVTASSTLVVSGAAAVAAVVLVQHFGRGNQTDGVIAGYSVYLLLAIAAQAFRVVVLPDLTRAAGEGRLGAEVAAYGVALAVVSVPAVAIAGLLAGPIGDVLTGTRPHAAARAASASLVWFVLSGVGQLFAALCASALAALDSYVVAAAGYAVGALGGLAFFVAFRGHGAVALAWGLALNSALALAIPLAALAARGGLAAPGRVAAGVRLWALVRGVALPLALQSLYLIGVPFAGRLGTGEITSFGYAYFIAAFLVAVTASSLSLISSAPLTRRGIGATEAAEHVVHTSWLSLAVIIAAAGVFVIVGGRIVAFVLGDAFGGQAGVDLGRLVAYFAPWMLASVALTLTFPLLFVLERASVLVPLALVLPALQIPLAWALGRAFGLPGIALAIALTTLVGLAAMMAALSRRTLALTALGLGRLAAVEGAVAALSFGVLAYVVGGIPAACGGLLLYGLLLVALRPRGLRDAWAYVRALH